MISVLAIWYIYESLAIVSEQQKLNLSINYDFYYTTNMHTLHTIGGRSDLLGVQLLLQCLFIVNSF